MRTARPLALLVVLLLSALAAGSANSAESAPTGLHGFLLRADEPQRTSFPRTPSFAWSPVPGALHYEFQLSLSDQFRDNSVVFADDNAVSPVEAPTVTLPWITGSPHALFARVRAIMPDGATPWSANFGFDMVPPPPPTPLSSYPGLLRWTPVEGASSYQVWLVDARKKEASVTNTLDEREFYTFHPTASWTGTVRWRVRALRVDAIARINGIPAVNYGPWSPIYTSTNPPLTGGPIKLVGTVSDVFSDGSANSPAHKLMPGFLWTGNQAVDGTSAELYRVYVFTDKQCLNEVYASAIIGSPAYAPRPLGPLALPGTAAGIAAARTQYLGDGAEPPSFTYDGGTVTTNESFPQASPTTAVPTAPGADVNPNGGASGSSSTGSSGSASSPPAPSSSSSSVSVTGNLGAPIDLWDTNWPESGYYWTVVAVAAVSPGANYSSVGLAGAKAGDIALPVTNAAGFNVGDGVLIGTGSTQEPGTIIGISGNTITLALGLKFGHGSGEPVVRTGGSLQYQDLELPQDVCAAGRVMRFGKESEPSLVSAGQLFATGLSDSGRLTSAASTTQFYGAPLVSWTPALGAKMYEVQWSKSQYPFNPVTLASGNNGVMTGSTSVVFPKELGPGTWWYRVRGFDYSLPTGAQQMSWSDPAKIVVAPPKFSIVGSKSVAPAKTKTKAGSASALTTYSTSNYSIGLPAGWTKTSNSTTLFVGKHGASTTVVASPYAGRGSQTMAQWAQTLAASMKSKGATALTTQVVHEPGGPAVYVAFQAANQTNAKHATIEEFFFDARPTAYVVAFDMPTSDVPALRADVAKIAASFRFR